MTSKFTIDPGKYTTVLTSCGRFDLLGETVASFLQHFATDKVIVAEDAERLRRPDLARLVAEELNVRAVEVVDTAEFRELSAKPDFKALGPRLGPKVKLLAKAMAGLSEEERAAVPLRLPGPLLPLGLPTSRPADCSAARPLRSGPANAKRSSPVSQPGSAPAGAKRTVCGGGNASGM